MVVRLVRLVVLLIAWLAFPAYTRRLQSTVNLASNSLYHEPAGVIASPLLAANPVAAFQVPGLGRVARRGGRALSNRTDTPEEYSDHVEMRSGARAPLTPKMASTKPTYWYYDNVEFMNEPLKFIEEHPEDFSEAMQAMVQYQKMTNEHVRPWGDLPMALREMAHLGESLFEKSKEADDLARVIMTADPDTMRQLAGDAKFAEKKALFQNLAVLPPENRGMLAIHDVMTRMKASGQLPALAAFPDDLKYTYKKVAEAKEAVRALNEKYTGLFLAVRVTDKLSSAAAQMKADRELGRPQGDRSPSYRGPGRLPSDWGPPPARQDERVRPPQGQRMPASLQGPQSPGALPSQNTRPPFTTPRPRGMGNSTRPTGVRGVVRNIFEGDQSAGRPLSR